MTKAVLRLAAAAVLAACAPAPTWAQSSLLDQLMRSKMVGQDVPAATTSRARTANEAQIEPAGRKALASNRALSAGVQALNDKWIKQIEPYRYCGFGWGKAEKMSLQWLLLEHLSAPAGMSALQSMEVDEYLAPFFARAPEAPVRFDFSQVPDKVDAAPLLGRLDAMFAESEAICRRRETAEGRSPEQEAADNGVILDLGQRMRAELAAQREAIKKPVFDAIAAARPAGG